MTLDSPELGIREPLIAETGDQYPLNRSRRPLEAFELLGVIGLANLLFDTIAVGDERFEDVT